MPADRDHPENTPPHFNQERKRKAEFIKPINELKAKVGNGGLSEDILNKAQALLENNTVDFQPLAEMYLNNLTKAVDRARTKFEKEDGEILIVAMIYPSIQLKANGGMFQYPLVTKIADRLIQFLEVIEVPDIDALEIVLAFHTTIKAVIMGNIKGTGGRHGDDLVQALNQACMRYFEKYPENKSLYKLDYDEEF